MGLSTAGEAQASHDVLNQDNIAVESTNGATCIYAGDLADQMIFDSKELNPAAFAALGSPAAIVVSAPGMIGATRLSSTITAPEALGNLP